MWPRREDGPDHPTNSPSRGSHKI
ncbi:hypothetical protein Taro_007630, partial [Colocasia esculenta]|nr:hypothetical protein [Colocasia esculenta]